MKWVLDIIVIVAPAIPVPWGVELISTPQGHIWPDKGRLRPFVAGLQDISYLTNAVFVKRDGVLKFADVLTAR